MLTLSVMYGEKMTKSGRDLMNYQERKEKAREAAQEWQRDQAPKSWGDCAEMCDRLQKLAKRYGLIKELKREGVL